MQLALITLLLTVQFSLQNTTKILPAFRIYQGETAIPNSVPYQVGLYITLQSQVESFCGGSLINTKFVLTAAHCLENVLSICVIIGAHSILNPDSSVVIMNTTKYKMHEQYDPNTVANDIAVVMLPRNVKLTTNIAKVKLPKESEKGKSYKGRYGKLTGWGRTSPDENKISDSLKELRVRLVNSNECIGYDLAASNLCGYGINGNACMGDSGGPLILENTNKQIGIISYGSGEGCSKDQAHIYTKVAWYLDWIQLNSNCKTKF